MTREDLDRLADEARDVACRLERMTSLAAICGRAPDELHRPDSDLPDRLREDAVTLRGWAMRLSPTSVEPGASRMIAADRLDQPGPLAEHLDIVCDCLEAAWEFWSTEDATVDGAQWCAGIKALSTVRAFVADLEGDCDPKWVAAVADLLKQACEEVEKTSGQPSPPEDFAGGIAQAREAAQQLHAMAATYIDVKPALDFPE